VPETVTAIFFNKAHKQLWD